MKVSISITEAENSFLEGLVRDGRASSRSHAVRLAIRHMMEAVE